MRLVKYGSVSHALAPIHHQRRSYASMYTSLLTMVQVAGQSLKQLEMLAAVVVRDAAAPVASGLGHWVSRLPLPMWTHRAGSWLAVHLTAEWLVGIFASILSVAAYAWYSSRGLTMAYTDSISHMMIARRIIASESPGLAQLGTTWLPLNHVFMLPLIWNDTLWRDGFAGCFPSMVAYVIGCIFMFRLGKQCFANSGAGWVAALVFMLNPNVLYMQATPMSEMDLISAIIIAAFYTVRWAITFAPSDLVKSAVAAAAATLLRYDGWALALAIAIAVAWIAWRQRGVRYAEASSLLFGMMGFVGCAAWLIYQQVIFGNALAFYDGNYSAKYQQNYIQSSTGLPSAGNPMLSLHIYSQAVIDSVSLPIALCSLLGLVYLLFRYTLHPRSLAIFTLLAPFVFNWMSIEKGVTIIETPEIAFVGQHTFFNERYGLVMIPAIALLSSFVATRRRLLLIGLIGVVIAFGIAGSFLSIPYDLQDPLQGVGTPGYAAQHQAGQWIASHYHSGKILISYSPQAPTMFFTNLPNQDFITDSDAGLFQQACRVPQNTVNWIVMDSSGVAYNPVWVALHNRQDWRQFFVLRTTIGTTQIYERLGSSPTVITSSRYISSMSTPATAYMDGTLDQTITRERQQLVETSRRFE